MDRSPRVLAAALALLSCLPGLAAAQTAPPGPVAFGDTLFAGVDAAFRLAFDDEGGLWYTTEGGLVHVDAATQTRELITAVEGLPSSYSLGLAARGAKVYVATDKGLGVVDRVTGQVEGFTRENSGIPAGTIQDVALDGEDAWLATRSFGVARWNLTTGEWSVHNTSAAAKPPLPVRRVVPLPSGVWAATEGDGLWKYDRAEGTWTRFGKAEGLASTRVLSLAEHAGELWLGTDAGLQRWSEATRQGRTYTTADGMPHDRVLDVDVVPDVEDTPGVWASTARGAWQLDLETGQGVAHGADFGVLGSYHLDNLWNAEHGWAFGTERGVSLFGNDGQWRYYSTSGRGVPPSGPFTSRITAADAGDGGPFLWFGTHMGLVAYERPTATRAGAWYNLGPSQRYPGSVVNFVDTDGNTTWFATNNGTYGYDRQRNEWLSRTIAGARNLVYGVDADRGTLWIPLFGEGLLAEDLATGVRRAWDHGTALSIPDINLLDVRVQGDDVWVACSRGVIRMDRVAGTVEAFYTQRDGIPGGTVYRVLPDGPVVWLGTQDGGVARLDVAAGRVTRVWNSTTTPGFRHHDVRALHREGDHLWAGSLSGLWRLDLSTGEDRVFNQSNSGLVQDFVQGITSADGILYVATYSGVGRMDLATGEFLPMRDGPGVARGTPPASIPDPVRSAGVSVRIDAPREGAAVAGLVTLRGSALRFGGQVDRVEVRVGEGPWLAAEGTESWRFEWDATRAEPERPVTVRARAVAGGETSREAALTLTPVPPPTVPLSLDDLSPESAVAGQPFVVTARVLGDAPLSAALYYKTNPNATVWTRLAMTERDHLFTAAVPAQAMREGELLYYLEAASGPLTLASPEDPREPMRVPVAAPPRADLALEGPAGLRAQAGASTRIPLQVANLGIAPVMVRLQAQGLRATWVQMDAEPFTLQPGERRTVEATLAVPAAAFRDNATLTFEAREPGAASPSATTGVQVSIEAADAASAPASSPGGGGRIPLALPVVLAALALGALAARRRRA